MTLEHFIIIFFNVINTLFNYRMLNRSHGYIQKAMLHRNVLMNIYLYIYEFVELNMICYALFKHGC